MRPLVTPSNYTGKSDAEHLDEEIHADELEAVGNGTVSEVGVHVPVFHPYRYDAELGVAIHLDPFDCQNVGIHDLFGNQHLLTKPLAAA